jgi:hypothetical protein
LHLLLLLLLLPHHRSSLPRLLYPLTSLTRLVLEGSALDQPDLGHVVGEWQLEGGGGASAHCD